MRATAEEVCDVLKTLANPGRLMALCELLHGERSVGDLAERVGLRDQTMSQQLAILRAKGYVATRRDGQTIYYSLARDDLRRVIGALYDEYCADDGESAGA
ncbi:MAG: metalloregulator ArsR/SmtB family transcription factor [Caulobacterales bacterium]|nr:metalloregulator ArsR/SmtB family transcription factor [Caulobacterales bacterium]